MTRFFKTIVLRQVIVCFLLTTLFSLSADAAEKLSQSKIEELVSPIALYPDPLLAQILPASTFPDQIADAALLIRNKTDAEVIKDQTWDDSVKVIATYPGVLKMMYEKLDWTGQLGNAFLEQHEDVLDAVQTMRKKAQSVGNLKSSSQQKVTEKEVSGEKVIVIEPSDPQVIYVPQETTTVVYTESVSTANYWVPVATFGLGLALGAAINNNNDNYYYGGSYYGGPWHGGMWGGNNNFNHWTDRRYDSIDHYTDARRDVANNRIDSRQDVANNAIDSRQDRYENRQNQVNDRRENRPDQVSNRQEQLKSKSGDYRANSDQRSQKLDSAKSSMNSRGYDSQTRSPGSKTSNWPKSGSSSSSWSGRSSGSSSWSGQGGSSYSNRASTRGSTSRSTSSYSRSSSGYSRGGGGYRGGGGSRGGGGRRR